MRSVFSSIGAYFRDVLATTRSVLYSCFTGVPYLLSSGEYRKEVTEQYPDPISSKTADDLPARSRGLLFNDIDRCTGCGECAIICPTACIKIEDEPGANDTKTWVAVFDINFSKCVFCGLCTEVCEPASLVHTKQFEGAVYVPKDLVVSFGRGYVTPDQRVKWATLKKQGEKEKEFV